MNTLTKYVAVAGLTVAALAWASTAPTRAAEDMATMMENAKTAADHEAIAAHYDKEAADALAKAEEHRRMLAVVKKQGGPGVAKWHIDQHCTDLIASYEKAAKMYAELAKAHREMAEEKK